ncbi:variable large family protein [Borrelia hermsii]|uniref:Variable large protein n=1 Tax=Borrelia hermsii MTW TaxID=1313291 RepID=W5T682_BORHE|nr:variable large family protein [Borrelia hermsii]AHH14669.1 Variable major outer membrane lipoprotein [Borrelia hermsii MTW]
MSGGIALCSLVKDGGKLALHSDNDNKEVEVARATNKLLGAIEDIIREIMKKVFDKVKQEVDNTKKLK